MGYFSNLDIELKQNARKIFERFTGRPFPDTFQAWRQPTKAEIKRGYGAIHYKDINAILWLKDDGSLKKWIVCPHDGLRYYR